MSSGQPTNPPVRLRLLTRADVPFADLLRALAGWNQTPADWDRFLATEPDGCFVAEWNGAPAGTATTTVYGLELAWIGMLLVHPDCRRRGLGRALLLRCLEYLRGRGVRCVKLDATPAGRTVYQGLGFRDEWTLRRWVGARAGLSAAALVPADRSASANSQPGKAKENRPLIHRWETVAEDDESRQGRKKMRHQTYGPGHLAAGLRPWQGADAALVAPLDAAAFGIARQRLLAALALQSLAGLVVESARGPLAGYGLLRPGSQALYLGPVVAESDAAGIVLAEGLLAQAAGQTVFWDIPDPNAAAVSWAEANGFTVQRPLTRMYLGENLVPGNPRQQFALAGPEVG